MSATQTPTSIFVISGNYFDVINPDVNDVYAIDFAWGMSGVNRFNNQVVQPWDVLSHTGLVYQIAMQDTRGAISDHNRLGLLVHDAAEGYIGDMSRPLKSVMPDYARVESHLMDVILARFGVRREQIDWEFVRRYDNQALWIEQQLLRPFAPHQDAIWSLKQYDMPVLPKLSKATIDQYFGVLREVAINVGTLDLKELFAIPTWIAGVVRAQPAFSQAPAPAAQAQQQQAQPKYDPRTNNGYIDVPAEKASLSLDEVRAKSVQGEALDEARGNLDALLNDRPAPGVDLYGAR